MKRLLVVALAGLISMPLMAGDAFAGGKKYRHYKRHHHGRHYKRHHFGHRRYHHFRRHYGYKRFYRRHYVYGPKFFYYGPYYPYYKRHHHHHYYSPPPPPVYKETHVYSSSGPSNGGQVLGAILGGIGGGVIGHQIGGGSGKVVATVAGSLIGVLVGSEIGRQLDERDRLILARTTNQTLETTPSGTAVPWRNPDSSAHGTVTAQPAYQNNQGAYCREYQQDVNISGKNESAHGTACRNPDGTWKLVPTR